MRQSIRNLFLYLTAMWLLPIPGTSLLTPVLLVGIAVRPRLLRLAVRYIRRRIHVTRR